MRARDGRMPFILSQARTGAFYSIYAVDDIADMPAGDRGYGSDANGVTGEVGREPRNWQFDLGTCT